MLFSRHTFLRPLVLAACAWAGTTGHAQTTDLASAYRAALQADAAYRSAQAANRVQQERVPLAAAQLRPNVSLNASRNTNRLDTRTNTQSAQDDYLSGNTSLTLRQPIYRPALTIGLEQARVQVQDADAVLRYEAQQVASRVAGAYFDALLSLEQERQAEAQVAFTRSQLGLATEAFKAGTGTRTEIDEAQARYDMAQAQELESRQLTAYTRRQLQALTQMPAQPLSRIDPARLDLAALQPAGIEHWLSAAEAANPELQALRLRVESAELEVRKIQASHQPTLDAVAQWSVSESENVTRLYTRYNQKTIGLQLNVPLYAGGAVVAQTRQALAESERLREQLESSRRELALRVHKEHRSVTEGAARIRALQQALLSATSLVHSTRMSQQAGVRTFVDVLNAEQQQYQARKELTSAQHQYVLAYVRLMTLSSQAGEPLIEQINQWLETTPPQ